MGTDAWAAGGDGGSAGDRERVVQVTDKARRAVQEYLTARAASSRWARTNRAQTTM